MSTSTIAEVAPEDLQRLLTAQRAAIAFAAAGEHPLASYWYGGDTEDFQRFLLKTTSGAVSRNDFSLAYINHSVPFSGVGMSGSGAYHGKAGFETFSHQRPIAQSDLPVALAGAFVPPLAPKRIVDALTATATAAAAAIARLREDNVRT